LLKNDAGYVRIVAGQFQNTRGIAQTFSPMNVLDVHLKKGYQITLPADHGDTTLIYLRRGRIQFSADEDLLEEQAMAMMSSFDTDVAITALENCDLLFLSAPPLHEPINGHGFFVMNRYDEILQAYEDLKTDRFGKY
jgi:redox-sensitive bicupin YhaK (pirin superfamily)